MKSDEELREFALGQCEWRVNRNLQRAWVDGALLGYREAAKDAEKLAREARVKTLEEVEELASETDLTLQIVRSLLTQARKGL